MYKELTSEQLSAAVNRTLSFRNQGIDPNVPNLRFCAALEDCDGSSLSIMLRFHTYPWMANPNNVTHGGMIASILDSSMGTLCAALYSTIPPTISMTINYARPVPLDADVLVHVWATYTGGTSAQLSAEMYLPGEPKDPLATSIGVYHVAHAAKRAQA